MAYCSGTPPALPPPEIVICLDLFGVNFRLNYSSEIIRIARSLQTLDKSNEHGWRTRLVGSGVSKWSGTSQIYASFKYFPPDVLPCSDLPDAY